MTTALTRYDATLDTQVGPMLAKLGACIATPLVAD